MLKAEERGKQASVEGFAHEHIVVGILMKKYQNVSLVDLPHSTYDIIIVFKMASGEEIIRAQVKTSRTRISFTGGTRGGVDREYKSGVKEYIQSPETSDVIIGCKPVNDSFELYFVPTILIPERHTKGKSLNLIEPLKNNYKMLEKCKDKDFVLSRARAYGLIE